MRVAALTLLLGLSPLAADAANCSSFVCTVPNQLVANSTLVKCDAAGCNSVLCCTAAPNQPPKVATTPTCADYVCANGFVLRQGAAAIKCFKDPCSAVDSTTCCYQLSGYRAASGYNGTSVAPIPGSCKVTLPFGGFAPWETYKVLKTGTTKIRTPSKAIMGGQTLNISNFNIRASQFKCEKINQEWRALAETQGMATFSLHDALTPLEVNTQCFLSSISMYRSDLGIPGLRFDYGQCSLGQATQATILVGLRKVPDNYGETPNLRQFFTDVCDDEANETKDDAKLRFDVIEVIKGLNGKDAWGCWANSADMTLMYSDASCFNPAMVLTLLDVNNHFPVFPVKDSEWEYFVNKIPPMQEAGLAPIQTTTEAPTTTTVTDAPKPTTTTEFDPCAPPAPAAPGAPTLPPAPVPDSCKPQTPPEHPKVYGHVVMDRLCIAMPELHCHNDCGKVCLAVAPKSVTTTTSPGVCKACYDCEWDEVIYAFWGTLLVFWLVQCCHRNCVTQDMSWIWMPRDSLPPYSLLNPQPGCRLPGAQVAQPDTTVTQADFGRAGAFGPALFTFSLLTLIVTFIVYYGILNMLNYLIVVVWWKKEMCLKIWSFQTNLDQGYGWESALHWAWFWFDSFAFQNGYATKRFNCFNDFCPERLLGLVITTWLCLTALFAHWRYFYMTVETAQSYVTTEETKVEMGPGIPGNMAAGRSLLPCVVQ